MLLLSNLISFTEASVKEGFSCNKAEKSIFFFLINQ